MRTLSNIGPDFFFYSAWRNRALRDLLNSDDPDRRNLRINQLKQMTRDSYLQQIIAAFETESQESSLEVARLNLRVRLRVVAWKPAWQVEKPKKENPRYAPPTISLMGSTPLLLGSEPPAGAQARVELSRELTDLEVRELLDFIKSGFDEIDRLGGASAVSFPAIADGATVQQVLSGEAFYDKTVNAPAERDMPEALQDFLGEWTRAIFLLLDYDRKNGTTMVRDYFVGQLSGFYIVAFQDVSTGARRAQTTINPKRVRLPQSFYDFIVREFVMAVDDPKLLDPIYDWTSGGLWKYNDSIWHLRFDWLPIFYRSLELGIAPNRMITFLDRHIHDAKWKCDHHPSEQGRAELQAWNRIKRRFKKLVERRNQLRAGVVTN